LHIESPEAASLSDEYPGIVDTGFDGFVFMSPEIACQLGCAPSGAAPIETADGTRVEVLTAPCIVNIANYQVTGTALISPSAPDILYGNDFLKKAGLRLICDPAKQTCELTDQD
jgi:clan AA aspartic protease